MQIFRATDSSSKMFPPVHAGDVGFDIEAPVFYVGKIVQPQTFILINTGLSVVLPPLVYLRVEPRSSRFKKGLLTHGIIDNGYRGLIKLVLWNIGSEPYTIQENDRLCQLIPTLALSLNVSYHNGVPDSQSERGTNGLGSTDNSR